MLITLQEIKKKVMFVSPDPTANPLTSVLQINIGIKMEKLVKNEDCLIVLPKNLIYLI